MTYAEAIASIIEFETQDFEAVENAYSQYSDSDLNSQYWRVKENIYEATIADYEYYLNDEWVSQLKGLAILIEEEANRRGLSLEYLD